LDQTLFGDEDWDWQLRIALRHPVGFVAAPCVLFLQRTTPADDALRWQRWPYTRRVFLRNMRRSGVRRPSLTYLARCYLRHAGTYHGWFMGSALEHARLGQRRAAGRELYHGLRVSPWHTVRDVLGPSALWQTLSAFRKGPRRSSAPDVV
ncbi:MAG: hypothetical protein ACRD1G_18510, partial [Acidimicrobiales bacterium]